MSCSFGRRPSNTTGGDNITARSILTKYKLLKYHEECIFWILVFPAALHLHICCTF